MIILSNYSNKIIYNQELFYEFINLQGIYSYLKREWMKKTLITSLFAIILITNQLNAQEKPKTNEELVAEFMQLEEKTKNQKIQIKEQENEIKVLDKLEKTVDEVAKTLGVDK